MKRGRTLLLNRNVRLMMSEDLSRAVHNAAVKDLTTVSEYCRRAIRERLRKDQVPIVGRENEVAA
jgi:hypothetical protein